MALLEKETAFFHQPEAPVAGPDIDPEDLGDIEDSATIDGLDELPDSVRLYLNEIGSVPIPDHQEQLSLARRSKTGDRQALERLVEGNLRLVIGVAKRYTGRGRELLDLIQAGNIGLIKAARKFDPERGFKFSTYAMWWIRQAITRALADESRMIRLPVHKAELVSKFLAVQRKLTTQLERQPSVDELAEAMGLSNKAISGLAEMALEPLSLELPIGPDGESRLADVVQDSEVKAPLEMAINRARNEEVERILSDLTPREARILRLRYGFGGCSPMTLQQVGRLMGVTRERIRQIEIRALQKLKGSPRLLSLKEYA